MNEAANSSWSGAEQYDPMASVAEQDFGNLIDFDIDIDFGVYSANGPNAQDNNQQLTELADSLDMQHFSPSISNEHRDATNGAPPQQQNGHTGNAMSQPGNGFYDFNIPAFTQPIQSQIPFSTAQDPTFRSHAGVPPTPNSVEMHGDAAARYLQQMDLQTRAFFEQRYQLRKEDVVAFTPLVSPAVTPHDSRFQIPEYTTVPGAYFSPLTSPALKAQNQQNKGSYQQNQYNTSGSSAGTSPIEIDVDMLGDAVISQPEPTRRLRSNKRNAPRSSGSSTRVRQSPIVKPSRRKGTLSSTIPPKEVSDLLDEVQRSKTTQASSNTLPLPQSRDSSEAESISPEPLSEMRPPPRPGSVTHSPAITAKSGQTSAPSNASVQGVCPATPASLMRLQQSPNFSRQDAPPMLDDLSLPEAASSFSRPSLSRIDTAIQDNDQSTPRMSARKTPKLGPMSTPSAGAALSGKPSPMLSALASPTSPGFAVNGNKRADAKGGRMNKKRNSTSSTLVSPALRPKISPSIKPLLPEGAIADDTHALLLASKSNYQNILDGTTVPGVTYPTSLSTNLTSKRTSHKIAEQGRRNRINTALQEMQSLLPSPQITAKDAKSPDGSGAGSGGGNTAQQQSNSKAATVESAIEYIKTLQKRMNEQDKLVNEKDKLISEKDKEMEALRKELKELAASKKGNNITEAEGDTETETKKEVDSGAEVEDGT